MSAVVAFGLHCVDNIAGSVTEGGNTASASLRGIAQYSDGSKASAALIRLRPTQYTSSENGIPDSLKRFDIIYISFSAQKIMANF